MTQSGGQNLGTVSGKILIDASDLTRIQALTQQVGQTVARNLGQIDGAAKRTQASVGNLSGALGQLGGAFGLITGVGLVAQLGRMALQADAVATSYRRQNIAALSLAGSQEKLNQLLTTYNKATGNTINEAQALSDVTRLQAVGFADSAKELEEFTIASRGISVAMGSQQDYIIGQLQLAIANQSKMRLDQIGLGVGEVTRKIKELKAADSTLTTEMAYQNAVLGIATAKYGALAKSVEAQATGAEKAAKAWKELQLQIGEDAGPAIGGIMQGMADQIEGIAENFRGLARDIEFAKRALSDQGWTMPQWLKSAWNADLSGGIGNRSLEQMSIGSQIASRQNMRAGLQSGLERLRSDGASQAEIARQEALLKQVNAELFRFSAALQLASGAAARTSGAIFTPGQWGGGAVSAGPRFTEDQTAAIEQWAADVQDVERQAGAARVDATQQFEQQRADAISSYGRSIVREEQDFSRQRAKAFRDYAKQVADVQEDAAKRAADAMQDYADAVADVQAQAAKREAKWVEDYNERVADLRADGNERLVELEADYNRERERAAEDHRDRLFDAAGRLDAVAVRNEQKAYARSEQDARENYDDQREKLNKALAEQLADAQEAHQERIADAREADAERLADMQEAHAEQLAEAREADAERLADMKAAFDKRLADEDEERAIANQRRAEDHATQMAQMAQAQADRMAKIDEQEAREKKSLNEAFMEELESLGIHNENWLKLQEAQQKASIQMFDKFWEELKKRFATQGPKTEAEAALIEQRNLGVFGYARGGPVNQTRQALVHAGEFVLNPQTTAALRGAMGGSFDQQSLTNAVGGKSISVGEINVHAAPGMDEYLLAREVKRQVINLFQEAS